MNPQNQSISSIDIIITIISLIIKMSYMTIRLKTISIILSIVIYSRTYIVLPRLRLINIIFIIGSLLKLYYCLKVSCRKDFMALAAIINHLESESCGCMRSDVVQKRVQYIVDPRRMIQA
ncbi:unnamed protein product [Fusarium graminearum]|uniref:Uncharacterized protein n=1 Tax=Gibberella zeae TaxID=5518 RepID=A0A9N8NL96_GIBZA|nr:unnamed protein product [Fusarium graminearum]